MQSAAQYGLNADHLRKIIQATDDALAKMRQLNNNVSAQASALMSANQSNSGKILNDRFSVWAQDFGQIAGNLTNLNGKVKGLLQLSLQTADDAASTSGQGQ
ncbi:hypothetical protein [Saccharopolyspora spinosa]|uniref:hypothetical protein n=1 Tax=Saccharopolyspora spinosa TaxID=60894 RepID=UPI000237AD2C|nr:hypothetical protein [Saccharopolyspora spinosa]